MVVYVILALLLVKDEGQRRAAVIAAVVVSLLVGVSRVLLGVHWPSDVAGGWAFGLLWVMLVWHERSRWAPAKGT
jgi:membrane-associated phospholipid phosphatase